MTLPSRRLLGGFLLLSFLLLASLAPQQRQNSKTRVLRGRMEVSSAYNGPLLMHSNIHQYSFQHTADFTFTEEYDAVGYQRWLSGTVNWSAKGNSRLTDVPGVWETCNGSGTYKFGDMSPNSGDPGAVSIPINCARPKEGPAMDAEAFAEPPKHLWWDACMPKLGECSCWHEDIASNGTPPVKIRSSTTVASSGIDAVIQVSTRKGGDYWNFVPVPGHTITFSIRSNPPAKFKFELLPNEVSHFPGFAMNANVDDEFFRRSDLMHLRGQYANDGPDLIFNPKDYPASDWQQTGLGTVQTTKERDGATVIVTAMDFGAYGKLRASVIGGECPGGGGRVRIIVDGKESPDPWITIPLDQDGNLIADRMDEERNGITDWGYRGDPGRDDDSEPNGDGTAGDGFTAFEEYRGFMVADSPDCSRTTHMRTNPGKKDLFIYAKDPKLAAMATLFAPVSGLDVHLLCKDNLQGPLVRNAKESEQEGARVVNFTLQKNGPKKWPNDRGVDQTISQENPQHALYLVDTTLPHGTDGETLGDGPPRWHRAITVDKRKCLNQGASHGVGNHQLARVVIHELGHGVAIQHHGDKNIPTEDREPKPTIKGPIVLINENAGGEAIDFPSCPAGSKKGSVNGKTACMFNYIAVRNQQNSGEQKCPMKYIWWDWYVPADADLTPLNQEMAFKSGFLHLNSRMLPAYKMSPLTATLKPYNQTIDTLWLQGSLGRFCSAKKGTGINSGAQNHAGDADVGICQKQIHVNDVK